MQYLKKFNVRTTGILIYAFYTLFNWVIYSSFSTFNRLQNMQNNLNIPININYFSILDILTIYVMPLLFIAFLFILYKVNSKQKGEKPLKVFGIIFISLEVIFKLMSIQRIFRSSVETTELITFFVVLVLGICSSIGFVLFVLSKYKKTMLIIYSFGIIYLVNNTIFSVNSILMSISKNEIQNIFGNNPFNYAYLIYSMPNMLVKFSFSILIWFYCFFEIKNNSRILIDKN